MDLLAVERGVDGHRDVNLAGRDEVDDDTELVERAKDAREETMRDGLPVRVDVDNDDGVFDGDGRWEMLRPSLDWPARCSFRLSLEGGGIRLRVNDGTAAQGVLDVLDADRDRSPDDLLHGERVDDLGAVVGELSGLVGRDDRNQASRRDLARVGREDTVNLFPYLQLGGLETDGAERSTEVRIAAADLLKERSRDDAKVACRRRYRRESAFVRLKSEIDNETGRTRHDRHSGATLKEPLAHLLGQPVVELLAQAEFVQRLEVVLAYVVGEGRLNDVLKRDHLRVDALVPKGSGNDLAGEPLADADDRVLRLVRDLIDDLRVANKA